MGRFMLLVVALHFHRSKRRKHVERADALGFGHQMKFVVDVLQPDTSTCRLCRSKSSHMAHGEISFAVATLHSQRRWMMMTVTRSALVTATAACLELTAAKPVT